MNYDAIFQGEKLVSATMKGNILNIFFLQTDLSGSKKEVKEKLNFLNKYFLTIFNEEEKTKLMDSVSLKKHGFGHSSLSDCKGKQLATINQYNDIISVYINLDCSIEEYEACVFLLHDKFNNNVNFLKSNPSLFDIFN